ncbi:hypothetical protein SAMN03097699_0596 [Flavobacteriaceae bacterium MAR_2010_188]|nr:hypothetical protein SAMN03097699_0596 [Flavobacteriaceae bacterium MAR_2010_188]
MTCALCVEREANKKNTHYLSDGIIRQCLNIDGSNDRERGFYFDISNDNPFVEFNFQRLDEVTLENSLGRPATDEEIESAKQIPFSVDYVFCKECEDIFTETESSFTASILPQLRGSDLTDLTSISFEDNILIRMFCYIQLWRNSICEEVFNLPDDIKERLRLIILNKSDEGINDLPLSVSYLETLGGNKAFTENFVGSASGTNPFIIFMNDLVIQFYSSQEAVKFEHFFGLNRVDFNDYINRNEEEFIVKILTNVERKTLLKEYIYSEKVRISLSFMEETLQKIWLRLFNTYPPLPVKNDYKYGLIGKDTSNVLKYSKDQILTYTSDFIWNRVK